MVGDHTLTPFMRFNVVLKVHLGREDKTGTTLRICNFAAGRIRLGFCVEIAEYHSGV